MSFNRCSGLHQLDHAVNSGTEVPQSRRNIYNGIHPQTLSLLPHIFIKRCLWGSHPPLPFYRRDVIIHFVIVIRIVKSVEIVGFGYTTKSVRVIHIAFFVTSAIDMCRTSRSRQAVGTCSRTEAQPPTLGSIRDVLSVAIASCVEGST